MDGDISMPYTDSQTNIKFMAEMCFRRGKL